MRSRGILRSAVLCGLLLVGCATPIEYGAAETNRGFGYSQSLATDGSIILKVLTPTALGSTTAFAWWDRRAAEICGDSKIIKNIYSAIRPTVTYESYGGTPGDFFIEGYLRCDPPVGSPVQWDAPRR